MEDQGDGRGHHRAHQATWHQEVQRRCHPHHWTCPRTRQVPGAGQGRGAREEPGGVEQAAALWCLTAACPLIVSVHEMWEGESLVCVEGCVRCVEVV